MNCTCTSRSSPSCDRRRPAPDLVIYLQASPVSLPSAWRRRGNPIEARIGEDYLAALADSYTRYFHQYEEAPVLIVNTEHLNPIDSADDFAPAARPNRAPARAARILQPRRLNGSTRAHR